MAFPNETKREVWLAIRADGALGTGSPTDAYDMSSPTLFADRMNSFQPNTTIHLGPGIYPTFGYANGAPNNWQPKSGQRIIGAGIYATTLKVVEATLQNTLTLAIANNILDPTFTNGNFLDGFTACDFTVDCNMRAHTGKRVAIGAVSASGRRVRLRRIRVVDHGTETIQANAVECFPLAAAGAHPYAREAYDCVIEDCLLEKPSPNNTYTTSCILMNVGESAEHYTAFHRACVVRDCVVDSDYQDRPVAIASITYSGTTATVVAKTPHGRSTGDWVVVTGALVNSSEDNPFNGSYPITVLDSLRFQYTMLVAPAAQPAGDMWIGKTSSHVIGIKMNPTDTDPSNPGEQGVTVQNTGTNQWTVTVITEKPHLRVPGNNVTLNLVSVGLVPSKTLNDLFAISEVVNPTKLRFVINSTTSPGAPDSVQAFGAQIGPTFVGISADGGIGAIVERNRVYGTRFAFYHDSWSTKDLLIRKNYFYAVVIGVYQAMGNRTNREGSSLVHSGLTATFTSQKPHGLTNGQNVVISGASVNGLDSSLYNGSHTITVLAGNSFQYTMASDPGANASGSPVFTTLIAATSLVRDISSLSSPKAVFTTAAPHGLLANDFVSVFGAEVGGSISNPFNGAFKVLSVTTTPTYSFTYAIAMDPGADASGSPQSAKATACPLVNSGTAATFTTPLRHTLSAGQGIIVTNATDPSVTDSSYFEGGFQFQSVPSPTSLSFQMPGTPTGNAAPAAAFASLWQVGRLIGERNIIQLVLNPLKIQWGPPAGMVLDAGTNQGDPFVFRQVRLIRNFISNVDNAVDTSGAPFAAMNLFNCENALVRSNIINLNTPLPLAHSYSRSISYANNQTPRGAPIQGGLPPLALPHYVNELAMDAELAALSGKATT